MAEWLNRTFYSFDSGMFHIVNNWATVAGSFLNPFFKFISFFGASGLFFIILSVVLCLFKKSRKLGGTMLLSIIVGGLFTNVILKNLVARPRPYTVDEFKPMWEMAGAITESEYSFPSGHTTVTMVSMMSLFFICNKKWSWTGFFFVILMGLSRVYLFAHYLTDVLAGLIVGFVSGIIGYFVAKALFNMAEKNKDKKFFNFVLNFDLIGSFKKKPVTEDSDKDGNDNE